MNGWMWAWLIIIIATLVFELACVWLLPSLFGIDGIWCSWPLAELLALVLSAVLVGRFAPQLVNTSKKKKN